MNLLLLISIPGLKNMLEYLDDSYEQYEPKISENNKETKPSYSYLDEIKKVYLNKRENRFYADNRTSMTSYLDGLKSQLPEYANFMFQDNFIISYNFPLKIIYVYMGRNFNEDYLERVIEAVPKILGFKVLHNEYKSAFRTFDHKYYNIIHDNIIKFISFYPNDFDKIIKIYILRSYDFTCRNPSPEKLKNLHHNINVMKFKNTFNKCGNGDYMIVFKRIYPADGLMINVDNQYINVYNRKEELILCFENNAFYLLGISNISVHILKEDYDINLDECYNNVIKRCTELYYQTLPQNNNSPSSE